jgi:RNA polymerase sigma factor (sigma-70 family)
MTRGQRTSLLDYLHERTAREEIRRLSDRELLGCFTEQRDEAAFAALVSRHGPMVLRLCRRLLRHSHDAEDVFQATFFVLAKKAASVRWRESVAGWLYRTAAHLALHARTAAARRRTHEGQVRTASPADPLAEITLRECQQALDDALARLPEKYRTPLILCCLEGESRDEAAQQLGWSLQTLKGRLERGRELLRNLLERRGVTLVAALASVTLVRDAGAAVPPSLAKVASQAAVLFAGRAAATAALPVRAVALAEGAVKGLFTVRVTFLALLLLALAVAVPAVLLSQASDTAAPDVPPTPPSPATPRLDMAGDLLPPGALARLGTVRFRHGGLVTTLVYFPDGKTVASGALDDVIRLWDAASGKELRRLPGSHLAVAPDGKTWASWGGRSTGEKICLWDFTGRRLHEFTRRGRAYTATFSPDGKVLAVGGGCARNLNQLSLWDVTTGKELPAPQMGEQYDSVHRLAFAPDGKTLATSGDDDHTVRFWDLRTGKELAPLGYNGQALAYSPDGKILALEGYEKADPRNWTPLIRLFDVATRKELRQLRGLKGGCRALTFSRDGAILVAGDGAGLIHWWEMATGNELRAPAGHPDAVTALAFSPDGRTLASGSQDRTLRLWEVATGKPRQPSPGHQGEVSSVALSRDGRTVITAGWDKTIRLWDARTGLERRRLLGHQEPVRSLVLSPDGKTLVSYGSSVWQGDGVLRLWDVGTGRELSRGSRVQYSSPALAFFPDGKTLATAADFAVCFLDIATGKKQARTARVQGGVVFIAVASDGKSFAWGSPTDHFHLCDSGGKELRRFSGLKDSVGWAGFSPDSRQLFTLQASYNEGGTVRLWDVATRKELRRFRAGERGFLTAAVSPDGKTLATGGADGTVRLWDVEGKERRRFHGHQGGSGLLNSPSHLGGVVSLAWSADGKLLVSGGADTTALVWNVTSAADAPPR